MYAPATAENELNSKCDALLLETTEDVRSLRTGRATPAYIEDITVLAYGGQSKLRLQELATIAAEGPASLLVVPYDPSVIQEIEKAILSSPLGLSPRVDGTSIHIAIPTMTEDQRLKFVKFLSEKIELKKVGLRNLRDEARKKLKVAFEAKDISEDEKFRLEKEFDKITKVTEEKIDEIREKKHREIMEI